MTKVVVAGGAGFIGSHLVDALVLKGYDVTVLDNLLSKVHPASKMPAYANRRIRYVIDDVRKEHAWKRVLPGAGVVIHLAAYQDYDPNYQEFFTTNVGSLALLFKVLRELGQKPIVHYASSQAVYGNGKAVCPECGEAYAAAPGRSAERLEQKIWEPLCLCGAALKPLPNKENGRCLPLSPYGMSKYHGEQLLMLLAKMNGINATAFRYSIAIGARQSPYNQYSGLVRIVSQALFNGSPFRIYEDGQQLRDFVSVHDIVQSHIAALDTPKSYGQVYNIAGQYAYSVNTMVQALGQLFGLVPNAVYPGITRPGDTRHALSDGRKAASHLHILSLPIDAAIAEYVCWLYPNIRIDVPAASAILEAQRVDKYHVSTPVAA